MKFIREYPNSENDEVGQTPDFIVTLHATEKEYVDFSLSGDTFTALAEEAQAGPVSETYDLSCMGTVTEKDGRICLSYSECLGGDEDGLINENTEISFSPDSPGLVTVYREGAATVTMVLENSKRINCIYHTPFMDFDICVHTFKVENELTVEGGRLYLDYALEIRGAATHRTQMEIEVRKDSEKGD